jgi:hypothetical protein
MVATYQKGSHDKERYNQRSGSSTESPQEGERGERNNNKPSGSVESDRRGLNSYEKKESEKD